MRGRIERRGDSEWRKRERGRKRGEGGKPATRVPLPLARVRLRWNCWYLCSWKVEFSIVNTLKEGLLRPWGVTEGLIKTVP